MEIVFRSVDGQIFEDKAACERHDASIMTKQEQDAVRAMACYGVRRTVEKYGLSKHGVWHIRGEDPNCDFGGHHYQPSLGYFEGTLAQAIKHAVTFSNFFTWGGGGDLELINITR